MSAVEAGLLEVLKSAAEWTGAYDNVKLSLSSNLVRTCLDPQTLVSPVQVLQAGALPVGCVLDAMAHGGVMKTVAN